MTGLFQELKRRNVFKVGIAYVVAAWALLQVTDLMVPVLSLPDWTMRLVFLLLVIGFIPALLIAWAFELTPEGIRREGGGERPVSTAESTPGRLQPIISSVLFLVLIGIVVVWFTGHDARWARDVAFPEIEQHATDGEWEQAYALAKRVEALLPNNETLEKLWGSFAWLTSIPSNPSGAAVYRRSYTNTDADWEYLGTTPIYDTHVPFGLSLIRLELEDRPPLLRIVSGDPGGGFPNLAVQDVPFTYASRIAPGAFDFDTSESLPSGMVRVPGHTIALHGRQVEMRDFYIDRYEVTNQKFKEFVDSGGYQRRDFWEHDFVLDGVTISWQEAMRRLVDKSGRPGPSTWEAGSYADGEEEYPVSGISWYEAAAYARYTGRELPTLHHWRRAFASGLLTWTIPVSNLESGGLAPVGQYRGVGWTGTYDMVGNVREWCINAVDGQKVIVGGGWNDPPYQVLNSISDPGRVDPFNRSATNGFRLSASMDEPSVARILRMPVTASEEVTVADPVSDEVFAAYQNLFDYDQGPLNAATEEKLTERYWTRERITFAAGSGDERMPLYLYIPESGPSRHQVILYWPTTGALILDSVDQLTVQLDFALKNGRAVAFPVLDGTFERRQTMFPDWGTVAGRDLVIREIRDMRRSIDYLESRADIDANAIAFYGFSWGGRLGPIAMAVEPRIKVGVLNQAGLQHLLMPETSVLNYLPRVTIPVLQFNGRYDTDFRFETSAKPFFELIGTPDTDKKHVVEPTGHFVPRPVVIGETLNWLDKYLGPVTP